MMGNKLELRKKALALSMKGSDSLPIKKKPMAGMEGGEMGEEGQVMMALSAEEAAMIEKMRAEKMAGEAPEAEDAPEMMG